MGVSKPILENVIFCHQEESNWPLTEGAKLKQRFDEIFAATRYTKALENVKKIKKEQLAFVKEMRLKLETLKAHKNQSEKLWEFLETLKQRLKTQEELLIPVSKSYENLTKDLNHYRKLLKDHNEAIELIKELKIKINQCEKETESIKNEMKEELIGSFYF